MPQHPYKKNHYFALKHREALKTTLKNCTEVFIPLIMFTKMAPVTGNLESSLRCRTENLSRMLQHDLVG